MENNITDLKTDSSHVFLQLIVLLLKSQQSTSLQAYAAIILTNVVPFSRNKDDVGVLVQSITPVVFNLICSPNTFLRGKALWLFRNLVSKISISSIEEALAHVTSIILEDSIGFDVVRLASEILLVICQEHPKLSCEKLKLVLPALMKLIKSDDLLLLFSGH
ncbi:hypothetical protein POM88_039518 [Heracleum sosnowskyi]|uniref:Uncharacterized protein n=1 Tax=Heracleum sosnowskyi TaxID=360622 RepID=A0AAD8HD86_9APIA|nr:hypothetical protein POM88_039518 [Heracleum sosnowskyi]